MIDYYLFGAKLHVALKILDEDYIYPFNLPTHEDGLLSKSRKSTISQPASAEAATGSQRDLRLRVYSGSVIAMGPGKADLLAAIASTGSISGAGRALGMSYKRCWDLVETMNQSFVEPLVVTSAGGSSGGGAVLTVFGERVLTDYHALVETARTAVAPQLHQFRRHLK